MCNCYFWGFCRRSLKAFGCKAILVEPGIHNTPMATPDSLTGYYKRAWDEATPEIKEEYGEDYYSYGKQMAIWLLEISTFSRPKISVRIAPLAEIFMGYHWSPGHHDRILKDCCARFT